MGGSPRFVTVRHLLIAATLLAVLNGCLGKTANEVPKTQPEGATPTTSVSSTDDNFEIDPTAQVRLRIMAANTTSGSQQSYPNPGPGVRIFQGLSPDVVLIQEFQVEGSLDAWVDDVFGTDFDHCIEEVDGLPNGIVSRFPILQCGEWDDPFMLNRDFSFARIDLPGDLDLWAVSVHLKASSGSSNRQRRKNEGLELVERIEAEVPLEDFLVIGGDFNTQNRDEEVLDVLRRVVVVEAPFPGDDSSDGDTNSSRRKPYDWVLVDDDLEPFEVAVITGDRQFDDGLVFDSRSYSQDELDAAFSPVRQGDSGAPQMQHMAVVRDFLIAGPMPDPGDDDDGDDDDDNGGDDDDDPVIAAASRLDLSAMVIVQSGKTLRLEIPQGTQLAAGANLVIGRAANRQAFENCWGPLPATTVYLSGAEAGDDDSGFPQLNGGERFHLEDAAGQVVDPLDGQELPATRLSRHQSWRRLSSDSEASELGDSTPQATDPGTYAGQRHGNGRLILSEISDADDFRCEFVELFYDG